MNAGTPYVSALACTPEQWPLLYLCTVTVLAGFGLLVNLGVLYASVFATDDGGSATPTPFRCTPAGTLTMYALPWMGLIVATVAAAGLGLDAFGRGESPWRFLLAGAGAHLASIASVAAVVFWGRGGRMTAAR
ncbi:MULTISPECIES: hypothetical protein [unclassified Streptomyces]|uniref:hypothetical protein n=1 Tax=unclassified Streptomyces TaxID=2593676 RepID=UPI0015866390|nr:MULTISPECIES: hypothetical protein [unclassified Streptomyces]NUV39998.1 hypothetical protein [Streptomyces sp. CAI-24]NUV80776.1 hypothetical protein [Streptomyces sp. CAI-155]